MGTLNKGPVLIALGMDLKDGLDSEDRKIKTRHSRASFIGPDPEKGRCKSHDGRPLQ